MILPRPSSQDTEGRITVTADELIRLRHRARGFSFLPRQPVHSLLFGRHASRLRGRGLDFQELRPYGEGDDTRTIDWNATARLRSPFVRVHSEERDRPVILLVDQRLSMFFGSRRATKSVAAAEVAAAAAWRVTSLGDRVGAVVFSDDDTITIKPQARDRGALAVIGAVSDLNGRLPARAGSAGNPGALNEALRRASAFMPHDALLCLITDATGADAETVAMITDLTARNDAVAVFVHDPLEAELPRIGRVVVAQADRRLELDTDTAGLREGFAEDYQARAGRIDAFSKRRSIPVLPLGADRDPIDQLRTLLGERAARGARR